MKSHYPTLKRRAENVANMVNDRARLLAVKAGLPDCDMFPLLVHNALVSDHYGHPWKEIKDRKALRRANWLLNERQWQASRILDRLYSRLGSDAFDWS